MLTYVGELVHSLINHKDGNIPIKAVKFCSFYVV